MVGNAKPARGSWMHWDNVIVFQEEEAKDLENNQGNRKTKTGSRGVGECQAVREKKSRIIGGGPFLVKEVRMTLKELKKGVREEF